MQLTIFIEEISRKKEKRRLQFGQLDRTNVYTYGNKNECKPHVKEEHLKTYTYIYMGAYEPRY